MSLKTTITRGFDQNKYFRLRKKYYSSKLKLFRLFYKCLLRRIENKYCSSIGLPDGNDLFSTPPILVHGILGVFISKRAIIGKDCTIYQNVNILTSKGSAPKIGDNVFIGAGAILLGDINVGNNAKIGAGAIVTKDVPDNATIVCQPSRVIVEDNNDNF